MVASAASTEQICRECGDWTCQGNHYNPPDPGPDYGSEPDQATLDAVTVRCLIAYASDALAAQSLDRLLMTLERHASARDEYRRAHDEQALARLALETPSVLIDLEQLPRFGGDRPERVDGAVSWDELRVLVRSEQGFSIRPRSAQLGDELMASAHAVAGAKTLEDLRDRMAAFARLKREIAELHRAHREWLEGQPWYTAPGREIRAGAFEPTPSWWRSDLPLSVRLIGCDGTRILVRAADGQLEIVPVPPRPSWPMRLVRRVWPRSRNAFPALRGGRARGGGADRRDGPGAAP